MAQKAKRARDLRRLERNTAKEDGRSAQVQQDAEADQQAEARRSQADQGVSDHRSSLAMNEHDPCKTIRFGADRPRRLEALARGPWRHLAVALQSASSSTRPRRTLPDH
jgi:hypothetical protein